jgi:hypothetical protein
LSYHNHNKSNKGFGNRKRGVKVVYQIKERLDKLNRTQVWLILELHKRGITVQPPEMSGILRGVNTYPKSAKVLEVCNDILSEQESGT